MSQFESEIKGFKGKTATAVLYKSFCLGTFIEERNIPCRHKTVTIVIYSHSFALKVNSKTLKERTMERSAMSPVTSPHISICSLSVQIPKIAEGKFERKAL